jgi:hypothetical protein
MGLPVNRFVLSLPTETLTFILAKRSVDLESVVQKEALYCAIGRCAVRLKGVIPFTQWLEQTLVLEARDTNSK